MKCIKEHETLEFKEKKMELIFDKFGRVVIPKPVREGHGLGPGSGVKLIEEGDDIILRPLHKENRLIRKNGILMFTGEWPEELDIVEFIHRKRQEEAERHFPKGAK
jgi:AbrB family looped-hinge helix DNA binding protein